VHRNEQTIDIARPPAAVFPYLTEPERLKQWVGGLAAFEAVDGETARLGARSRQVMVIRGREWKLDGELTALEADRLVEARMVGKGFSARTRYALEPIKSGTRLTATVESEFSLLVARLFGGLVSREAQKKLSADLARLEALVETEPPVPDR
jgi:carbon monoxide dehydrogenase subunit G